MASISVRVQAAPFDADAEYRVLSAIPGVGAVVTFTGICRDEGGRLAALELERYPGMAEAEIQRIAEEAAKRWPRSGLSVIHRHGRIGVGDMIVLVAASTHRDAAFEAGAVRHGFLKTDAPFWKKEHPAAARSGEWVAAAGKDEVAAQRWKGCGWSAGFLRKRWRPPLGRLGCRLE